METTLRQLRTSRGITLEWTAKQLGLNRKTYHNYEIGKTRAPKSVLFHAAHLFHVSPDQLLNELHQ